MYFPPVNGKDGQLLRFTGKLPVNASSLKNQTKERALNQNYSNKEQGRAVVSNLFQTIEANF